MKQDLKNNSLDEIKATLKGLNAEQYRAKQVAQWVFQKKASSVHEMTNISKDFRNALGEIACISSFTPLKIDVSRDGSKKFLFKTTDGHGVESVLIPEKKHWTLCISTQIGCPLQCRFCYTGRNGLVRNLTAAEILNQIDAVFTTESFDKQLPNLVFMGMGEPLANYDNTLKTLQILTSSWGHHYSHRKITVSTAGLVPRIKQLGEDIHVNLAVSLNASNDKTRNYVMPVNKKYPLRELIEAAKRFPLPSRKRITFEYILIKGINDSAQNALELTKLLKNVPCKINLIPFNEHPAVDFETPDEKTIQRFQDVLHDNHFTAPIRRSKGSDIAAACGQLGDSAS